MVSLFTFLKSPSSPNQEYDIPKDSRDIHSHSGSFFEFSAWMIIVFFYLLSPVHTQTFHGYQNIYLNEWPPHSPDLNDLDFGFAASWRFRYAITCVMTDLKQRNNTLHSSHRIRYGLLVIMCFGLSMMLCNELTTNTESNTEGFH